VCGAKARPEVELRCADEAVEHVELRRGEGEAAMLVLPEEGEQPAAEQLQIRRGRRTPLHERARAPGRAYAATEHDLGGPVGESLGELA
jgi:hypothetical protein